MRRSVLASVVALRALVTEVREVVQIGFMEVDAPLHRGKDSAVSFAVPACITDGQNARTFVERITELHTQNEDVRALLHETVLWIDETLDKANGGLAPELRQGALDLVKRLEEADTHGE